MYEKKRILRQIGWSDELIEKCLSPDNKPQLQLSRFQYHVLIASEQDVTNPVLSVDTPTITDGTHL